MYNGDRSRKTTLVEFGFRLPSALDNRPLMWDEFLLKTDQMFFVSATPGPYELENSGQIVEQIIRPTGLVDPEVEVRPTKNQIDDLLNEVAKRVEHGERVLITTLTIKMSEDLTDYLLEHNVKARYMHSNIETLGPNPDHPGPAHRRVRRARRHQLASRGPRPPRGNARRHPGRGQGGFLARGACAHPDHRKGCA